jgi:hypothetical protein
MLFVVWPPALLARLISLSGGGLERDVRAASLTLALRDA